MMMMMMTLFDKRMSCDVIETFKKLMEFLIMVDFF